jgi:hypothetical protein
MFQRTVLSCAVLILTVAAPALAQDAKPSTASEDVIQDPMPHSRAEAPETSAPPTAPVGERFVRAAPKTAVSINPATLLFGGIGAEIDTAVQPTLSLFVAPSFFFFHSVFTPGTSLSGFGVDVGFRYFSERRAPKGFWVGPNAGIAFLNVSTGNFEFRTTGLSLGGMLGYSWISEGAFYFSTGIGGGYGAELRDWRISSTGPSLALRIAIGFAG